uniref:Uncharacterized protein n=1 Tax=Oryza nivara TaxID=4536 RepID=A0A0E0IT11_ORYNI
MVYKLCLHDHIEWVDILDVNKSMDKNCFNMAVLILTCNPLLLFLDDTIHYMDKQFRASIWPKYFLPGRQSNPI